MIYAYTRVSTKAQSLQRQLLNIRKAYPQIKGKDIYSEKFTGTKIDERKEFQKLLKKVKPGDLIVFDSVSRFSRQAAEGFQLYKDLFSKGIDLAFLKEPYIDTENYRAAMNINLPTVEDCALQPLMNGLQETMMILAERQFKQAFEQAEKEVKDLSERTREGMAAKGSGRKISETRKGKKYITEKEKDIKPKIIDLAKDFKGTLPDKRVIEILGISRNTYYKYKREIAANAQV